MKKQIRFNIRKTTLNKSKEQIYKYQNTELSDVVDLLIIEFLNNKELRTKILK